MKLIEHPKPCPKCHKNRWQIVEKHRKWRCRGVSYRHGESPKFCDYIREIKDGYPER